jgi:5-(carboxyamino)imidazole ribonucleotide mutase
VIGVPVPTRYLGGLDSLLSIVQMPGGVPVATVAIGQAKNAGLLAVQVLATGDEPLADRLGEFRAAEVTRVEGMDARVTDQASGR